MTARLSDSANVLRTHGLSLAEYFVMCSAGYRVTYPPEAFVEHALAASKGDPRGEVSIAELSAALDTLRARGLLSCLTQADVDAEARRRAASSIPEVIDLGYEAGVVDFTPEGYSVHREVIRAIYGDDLAARRDAGVNLDDAEGQFDVYAVSREHCRELMDMVEADGDSYTGKEGTRFVARTGPEAIGQWRPNRFVVHDAGYHGVLRFAAPS
jgi:hypothetical protein